MALTSAASGTQTATLTTEHTLSTQTTAGTYILNVDLSNLANGETVDLKLKVKTLSGGSSVLAYQGSYSHVQAAPSVFSVPVPVVVELVATLTQTGGTGRAYPWNLLRL